MEKLDGKSLDLTKENIQALKKLFPEVVTEGKVDFEKLKLILGEDIEVRDEKYEFTWHGKTKAIKLAQIPSTGTLRPDKKSSKNWETTNNLYIEGDNLEVLKLMQKAYFGKIKMIYIDPPYNTGNNFIYKDDFRDNIKNYKEWTNQKYKANTESSGRYHTEWLNMMYPRLKVARNLMREDGIIFVSIDSVEMANLRKVMNEIFGEENLVSELVWDLGTGTSAGHFTRSHEYILVFAKNKNKLANFSGGDGFIDDRAIKKVSQKNPASRFTFPAGVRFEAEDNTEFTNEWGNSEKVKLIKGKMKAFDGKLSEPVTLEAGWVMKNQMESWFRGEETFDSKGQKVIEFYFNSQGIPRYIKERSVINPPSVIKDKGSTRIGTRAVEQLLGLDNPFDFPKPVSLIKYLCGLVLDEGDIVLDFFAGSSTTAQAVIELNSEDNKNRNFIMIQFPEEIKKETEAYSKGYRTINDIAKERIRLSGDKIVEGKRNIELDIGFKVFKLDSSNIKEWDPHTKNIEQNLFELQENIKENRTKEDLLYEILLKIGIPLTAPIEEISIDENIIYNVGSGAILLCLEDEINLEIIKKMVKLKPDDFDTKIIFKEAGFLNDTVKTNAIQTLKKHGITDVRSV